MVEADLHPHHDVVDGFAVDKPVDRMVASQERCKCLGAGSGVMLRGGGDSLGDHLLGC
jgi:hypothetical protein